MTPVGFEKGSWQRACVLAADLLSDHHQGPRLMRGLDLAQSGAVTLAPVGDAALLAEVHSGRMTYEITCDLTCSCKDFDSARAEACKHILATLIHQGAIRSLAPSREPGDEAEAALLNAYEDELANPIREDEYHREYVLSSEGKPPKTLGETAQGCVGDLSILDVPAPDKPETPIPPAPEKAKAEGPQGCVGDSQPRVMYQVDNPAGFNFKARVGQDELWYTFHDVDDASLLARLKIVLPQLQALAEAYRATVKKPEAPIAGSGTFPRSNNNGTAPAPPIDGNDTDRSWCPHHQVHMDWHPENERGPGWYSHRLGSGGYCRGGN